MRVEPHRHCPFLAGTRSWPQHGGQHHGGRRASSPVEHYGAPVLLFALLLGVGVELPSSAGEPARPASNSPRAACYASGSPLLGMHASPWAESPSWAGCRCCWWSPWWVVTMGLSVVMARLMGFPAPVWHADRRGYRRHPVAPPPPGLAASCRAIPEGRATLFAMIGVSVLSRPTAMILYP